jgi:hypothetical protein
MFRNLKAELIVDTCGSTRQRVSERFPNSGLSKVAGEILAVSEQAADLAAWLAKPHLPLRALAGIGILTIILIVISVALHIKVQMSVNSIAEFLQGLDAAINEVVFIGIAAFFFVTLEVRLKRRRALAALRELRSLAHVIDMHQLTKDPERISDQPTGDKDGPRRPRSPAELIAYLDHCTDLLSLISKIAALYVQDFDDPVTLVAVNEIENLTNGLSRKIWQKIVIFDRILAPAGPAPDTAMSKAQLRS